MKYSKIPVAQSVVALCISKGITNVVISPGSRNAPLTIGFSEHSDIKAYSIVDERCAAFLALGMAQQLKQPVVLVCTSGSALLNYYPAIAEAFYSDIPLVVISADRPVERIDIGDGQTIRQKNVYGNHILYSANLYSEAVLEEHPKDIKLQQKQWESHRHNEQEINKALNTAIEEQGPVHINVPFYEPLYDTVSETSLEPFKVSPDVREKSVTEDELSRYTKIWNSSQRKLILIGVQDPNTIEQQFLDAFAKDESVIVMTETTSNVHHPNFFPSIDTIIAPIEQQDSKEELFKALQPEILLTFGGLIVSKKIKAFLRTYQPKHHWHVDPKKAYDTYFCLEKHFEYSPNTFLTTFSSLTKPVKSNYFEFWNAIKIERLRFQRDYEDSVPFSDFSAYKCLLEKLPNNSLVHLSNSSTIRYAQLFQLNKTIDVFCNRGTSGIDGSTSTAIGASLVSKKQTILITGDLSFFYDSNALWNAYIPSSFRIILINNNGGGIFRILPGHEDTETFNTYFETTHNLTAKQLCEMYNLKYENATSTEEIQHSLETFFDEADAPKLLEIFTPRIINDKVLKGYFKHLKS
ncbi:2-succinyl-5-enolpyruvyl-6-hydroxy-3-cyclohexene-1-carboxylic-acid synthase [Croceibacter atlanticus]|uniref:2-succinyl-5-enolpyruvyl-6-hydroxy-3- cyclohexene-1-carboxylic-acid synthase n=1 Tax=Croceibacter atlanticus TaxID=313588 RepID=UPI001C5E832C|nr:2-succinyl-5-enolpyruvyl-6-hydroxy-3-cyclohexene-1-carboxylic-acid synthase [Croceibacter atlanticus]MBW4970946.1 2-succinyl-5-enolpyruvyl-6-hydroxy-3-cyclohexene-1-carboxylic-acid synthase [Croceibacter atlanticus]